MPTADVASAFVGTVATPNGDAMETPVAAPLPLAAQISVARSTAVSAAKAIPAVFVAPALATARQSVPLKTPNGASTRQSLPFTGLDIQILMLIGLLMLLAGAGLRINATRPTRREKS